MVGLNNFHNEVKLWTCRPKVYLSKFLQVKAVCTTLQYLHHYICYKNCFRFFLYRGVPGHLSLLPAYKSTPDPRRTQSLSGMCGYIKLIYWRPWKSWKVECLKMSSCLLLRLLIAYEKLFNVGGRRETLYWIAWLNDQNLGHRQYQRRHTVRRRRRRQRSNTWSDHPQSQPAGATQEDVEREKTSQWWRAR